MVTKEVFFPESIQELLQYLDAYPRATIFSGGTGLLRLDASPYPIFKYPIVNLRKVTELRAISRTERYIDIGATVTLAEIIQTGPKAIPSPILKSCALVANPNVRNLATIGGNLCAKDRRMDLFAATSALDAKLELRSLNKGSRWISANRFFDSDGQPSLRLGEALIRVRLPYETWDISIVNKIGCREYPDTTSAVSCFLLSLSKNIIADIRFCFSGLKLVRDREIENELVGRRLPLSVKEINYAIDRYRQLCKDLELSPLHREQVASLALYHLSELQ